MGLASLAVVGALGGAAVVSKALKTSKLSALSAPIAPSSAARFLTQASFGATDSAIADVQSAGFAGWITAQQALPVGATHLSFLQKIQAALKANQPGYDLRPPQWYRSFWQQAASYPDQLRQRVKLALSEIFVISVANKEIAQLITGVGSYYDMLGANAFGNFRTLLEGVALHPMMGVYLTYFANLPANPVTGQHPDENFAREVMQLMTIGLYHLNPDGTVQADGTGAPIPTYTHADIAGLASVFTGFSWYSANPVANGGQQTFYPDRGGLPSDPLAPITPMIPYSVYHQTTSKSFLGVTIAASATPDALGDLKIALDTLFNHSNVGPFIGKGLIQRLITSNPSPAYVGRISAVFNDDGTGVRGNLGAVIQAILLDPEARDDAVVTSPTFGKLREPIIRVANWVRAFNATSTSGQWLVTTTTNSPSSLDQAALTAPSVFNFYVPGYVPPGTRMGGLDLVVPEFQAVDEISVAGYLNFMLAVISSGLGAAAHGSVVPDIQADYSSEIALAGIAANLVARLNLLLTYGAMSTAVQTRIVNAINTIPLPPAGAGPAALKAAQLRRVQMAIFMAFASPDYIVQR